MFRYLLLLLGLGAHAAQAAEYIGLCEASAGAYIDANHFVVASDETNKLQVYERGKPEPVGGGVDVEDFTSFDSSDLEAAARAGDRIYWISSHSFNKDGEDKAKRKVFFAAKIAVMGGELQFTRVGRPAKALRDAIAKAASVAPAELNIEAMAATSDGRLLIGLRAPLRDSKAIVIHFTNPAAVIDEPSTAPAIEAVEPVDLGGLGFRSLEAIGDGQYFIIAGPAADGDGFALFRWSGPATEPERVEGVDLSAIRPEAAMAVPGQSVVQLLSDDGDLCSDEKKNARRFRSIDVDLEDD